MKCAENLEIYWVYTEAVEPIIWFSKKSQFFSSVLIPKENSLIVSIPDAVHAYN